MSYSFWIVALILVHIGFLFMCPWEQLAWNVSINTRAKVETFGVASRKTVDHTVTDPSRTYALEPWSIGHSERSGLKVMRHAGWIWGQAPGP